MVPTGAGPPGRVTSVTSGSTDAPFGSTALIRAASEATLSGGALTTIAFLAGIAERAGDRVRHHRVDPADAHRAERDHRQPLLLLAA